MRSKRYNNAHLHENHLHLHWRLLYCFPLEPTKTWNFYINSKFNSQLEKSMTFSGTVFRSFMTFSLLGTSVAAMATGTDTLQLQIEDLRSENKLIMQRLEATMDLIDSNAEAATLDTGIKSSKSSSSHGHGSSGTTVVGGYGEMHYNNLSSGSTDKKQIDFHRFVLFFGHEFNDKIRFFSELELEHALVKDTVDGSNSGEVEIEQAFVEIDVSENANIKAGLFLIPIGSLNETHEPPAFYGVERNPVEKNIIPATWWEGGAMYSAHTDSGISYDLAIHSGLYSKTGSIRKSRQKVSNAPADSLAYTARIRYTGIRGLELASTLQYQSDFSQGTGTVGDAQDGTLVEAHAIYSTGGLKLSTYYTEWNINFNGGTTTGKDKQNGSIVEASYKVSSNWGFFTRQNNWTNDNGATSKAQTDLGFNYWPHEDVVFKADYQLQNADAGNFDGINLGVGYQF